MSRMIMFIDSNNFYKHSERLLGSKKIKFNWGDLIIGIRNEYQQYFPDATLLKAIYYTALSDRADNPVAFDKQSRFIEAIKKIPYVEVRTGYLIRQPKDPLVPVDRNNPETYFHRDKETDIKLSNDLLENAWLKKYEHAVIVSADGDFKDTIEKVKQQGVHVAAVIPVGTPAYSIKSVVHGTYYLSADFLNRYTIK